MVRTLGHPKDKGVELADVLVWYEDVVLLFEAKTRTGFESDINWV